MTVWCNLKVESKEQQQCDRCPGERFLEFWHPYDPGALAMLICHYYFSNVEVFSEKKS